MNIVHVRSVLHRGVRRVMLEFKFDPDLIRIIKSINDVRWSASRKCWHAPYTDTCIQEISDLIRDGYISVPEFEELTNERKFRYFDRNVKGENTEILKKFAGYLKVQRYSVRTIETYIDALKTFMSFFCDRNVGELERTDLMEFNLKYILKNQFSASYQNQIISAIKIFYRSCYDKDAEFDKVERPYRGRNLPEIFSREEVEMLLKSVRNLKHRTMLALIYACGLRRSEVLNLRIGSVDSRRRMLKIRGGKGNKDRLVPLPESLIIHLREYYKIYRPGIGTVMPRICWKMESI